MRQCTHLRALIQYFWPGLKKLLNPRAVEPSSVLALSWLKADAKWNYQPKAHGASGLVTSLDLAQIFRVPDQTWHNTSSLVSGKEPSKLSLKRTSQNQAQVGRVQACITPGELGKFLDCVTATSRQGQAVAVDGRLTDECNAILNIKSLSIA